VILRLSSGEAPSMLVGSFRMLLGAVCFSVLSFGSTVNYTELSSVVGGCGPAGSPYAVNGTCTVVTGPTNPLRLVDSVLAFTTNGAQMNGMTVAVTFSDGITDTQTWATIGPAANGAGGASEAAAAHKFTITETGDTFYPNNATNFFSFVNSAAGGLTVTDIVLNGSTGTNANCPTGTNPSISCGTEFDRLSNPDTSPPTSPQNEQTPGSHRGADLQVSGGNANGAFNITITYSQELKVTSTNVCNTGGAAAGSEPTTGPCDDVWEQVRIHFNTVLANGATFNFQSDTDNILGNAIVPEPSSLSLLAAGLAAGIVCVRRRTSASRTSVVRIT
jgi:hypothetical protein